MDSPSDTMRRLEERRCLFMSEPTVEQARRLRERHSIELRNKKRSENLIKRRTRGQTAKVCVPEVMSFLQNTDPRLADSSLDSFNKIVIIKDLLEVEHPLPVHQMALMLLREILTSGDEAPIGFAVDIGLTQVIISLCRLELPDDLVVESAWCLCNIASGGDDITEILVKSGAIEAFMSLLNTSNPLILEHSIWGIGNLIADYIETRDIFLGKRLILVFSTLTEAYNESYSKVYPIIAWTCSNIMRKKPMPPYSACHSICNILTRISAFPDSFLFAEDLLSAISNITNHDDIMISLIIDSRLLFDMVMGHLINKDVGLLKLALRSAGNIVTGNIHHTEFMLDKGFLDLLHPLISHAESTVRKEAFWSLSNIAASSIKHVEMLVNHNVMDVAPLGLVDIAEIVVREASFLFTNLCRASNDRMVLKLVYQNHILDYLSSAFSSQYPDVVINLLSLSNDILDIGKRNQSYSQKTVRSIFVELGCYEAVEKLSRHQNQDVAETANELLQKCSDDQQQQASLEFVVPAVFNFS